MRIFNLMIALLHFSSTTAQLTAGGPSTPAGLISASIAHAFALFVAVSIAANISGGHVNPAVTFGAFVGGHISLFRSILYWIAQLLGSVVACLLLKFATGGLVRSKLWKFLIHSLTHDKYNTFASGSGHTGSRTQFPENCIDYNPD